MRLSGPVQLVRGIANTLRSKRKLRVRLGQGRAVVDGTDAVLTAALAETEAGGRGVGNDVASDGLGTVLGEGHAVTVEER